MKRHTIILMLITIVVLSIPTIWYLKLKKESRQSAVRNFQQQLGSYALDIHKTNLRSYLKDSSYYKKLQITFKSDSTFSMNMKVPFIHDSVGRWNAGSAGLEDWNWLYYENWGYSEYQSNTGNQFTQPWTIDSMFYINGATPQTGSYGLQEIYFKKIKK